LEFEWLMVVAFIGVPNLIVSDKQLIKSRKELVEFGRDLIRVEDPKSKVLSEKYELNQLMEVVYFIIILDSFDNQKN